MNTYTVIYATGGRENSEWHRLSQTFATAAQAAQAKAEIVRGGRPAYVKTAAEVAAHGLPEGPCPDWDYKNLCWR